jgi:type II secretory pathway pseudopilin PulG
MRIKRTLASRYLRDGGSGTDPANGGGAGGGGSAGTGGAAGGANPAAGQPPAPQPPAGAQPGQPNEPLGEGGIRALQSERAMRTAAEQQLAAAQQQLQQLQAASQTDAERAIAAAREEGRNEIRSTANTVLVNAEVRAAAATAGFADPEDAVAQLQQRFPTIAVTPDGAVDRNTVTAMVTELATNKPYLLGQQHTQTPAFARNPGQGTPPAAPATGSVTAGADEYRRKKQTST